jgi:hypothetical protein
LVHLFGDTSVLPLSVRRVKLVDELANHLGTVRRLDLPQILEALNGGGESGYYEVGLTSF